MVWLAHAIAIRGDASEAERATTETALPSPRQAALRLQLPAAPDEGTLDPVVRRPIFSPSRRPPRPLDTPETKIPQAKSSHAPPPRPRPPPPRFKRERYRLIGLVATGENGVAFVEVGDSGEIRYLHTGDAIDGWTVQTIGPEGVTVRSAQDGAGAMDRIARPEPQIDTERVRIEPVEEAHPR